MATIREWLDAEGFDWTTGRIIFQPTDGGSPGWDSPKGVEELTRESAVLDKDFNDGYGGPQCPRFVAQDAERIFFPEQYDGATSLVFVWRDIARYLDWRSNWTPYPGG